MGKMGEKLRNRNSFWMYTPPKRELSQETSEHFGSVWFGHREGNMDSHHQHVSYATARTIRQAREMVLIRTLPKYDSLKM